MTPINCKTSPINSDEVREEHQISLDIIWNMRIISRTTRRLQCQLLVCENLNYVTFWIEQTKFERTKCIVRQGRNFDSKSWGTKLPFPFLLPPLPCCEKVKVGVRGRFFAPVDSSCRKIFLQHNSVLMNQKSTAHRHYCRVLYRNLKVGAVGRRQEGVTVAGSSGELRGWESIQNLGVQPPPQGSSIDPCNSGATFVESFMRLASVTAEMRSVPLSSEIGASRVCMPNTEYACWITDAYKWIAIIQWMQNGMDSNFRMRAHARLIFCGSMGSRRVIRADPGIDRKEPTEIMVMSFWMARPRLMTLRGLVGYLFSNKAPSGNHHEVPPWGYAPSIVSLVCRSWFHWKFGVWWKTSRVF